MPETESKFTVAVEATGVEATKAKLLGLERAASAAASAPGKAFSGAAENIDKMGAATDRLVQRMERLARIIGRVNRGAKTVGDGTEVSGQAGVPSTSPEVVAKRQRRKLSKKKEVEKEEEDWWLWTEARQKARSTKQRMSSRQQQYRDEVEAERDEGRSSLSKFGRRHAGSFGIGMFQSMLPGNLGFLQRGQGAIAQGLGMAAGKAIGGLASIPFAGGQGLANSMSVLGPLALPFQRFMSRAESGMSFQQQQLSLAPLMRTAGIEPQMGTKGAFANAVMQGGAAPLRLMGANINEGQGFMANLAASGGNRADQMSPAFIQAAMAAKTVLGVDANTTGAFALASRTNAVRGSEGLGADKLLMNALSQMESLGLSGADAQNYLQQIAEGIRQFQVSGMPLQMDSMRDITAGLTGLGGMSPLQAQRSATGVMAASQAFRDRGPQDGADLVMMRSAGFKGGLNSMLATKKLMGSNSDVYSNSMMSTISLLAKGPDREVALDAVRNFMKKNGMVPDDRNIEAIVDQARGGGDISKTYNDAIGAVQEAPDVTSQQLLGKASSMIPSSMTQQAAMANQGIAMGADAAGIALELDAAANDTASVLSRFSSGILALARVAHRLGGSATGTSSQTSMPAMRPAN